MAPAFRVTVEEKVDLTYLVNVARGFLEAVEKMSKSEPLKTQPLSGSPRGYEKFFQKLPKRAQLGGARKSLDVTCLLSTRQPVYRCAQAFGQGFFVPHYLAQILCRHYVLGRFRGVC